MATNAPTVPTVPTVSALEVIDTTINKTEFQIINDKRVVYNYGYKIGQKPTSVNFHIEEENGAQQVNGSLYGESFTFGQTPFKESNNIISNAINETCQTIINTVKQGL